MKKLFYLFFFAGIISLNSCKNAPSISLELELEVQPPTSFELRKIYNEDKSQIADMAIITLNSRFKKNGIKDYKINYLPSRNCININLKKIPYFPEGLEREDTLIAISNAIERTHNISCGSANVKFYHIAKLSKFSKYLSKIEKECNRGKDSLATDSFKFIFHQDKFSFLLAQKDTSRLFETLRKKTELLPRKTQFLPHKLETNFERKKENPFQHKLIQFSIVSGDAFLNSESIINVNYNESHYGPQVNLEFNRHGTLEWEKATEKSSINKTPIAVSVDRTIFSAPFAQEKINIGKVVISGGTSKQDFKDLAEVLNAGKLPSSLIIVKSKHKRN